MTQTWNDLLFAHWPIKPDVIRTLIPDSLQLDTFDGRAWIGVVPFHMSGIRLRWLPPVPFMSSFPEMNVRTYVVADGKPGVYFFSLDATNPIAVWTARTWFRLPYFNAHITVANEAGRIRYTSRRTHRPAPAGEFQAVYQPVSGVFHPHQGTLDHWLTERYRLYTIGRNKQVYHGEIHHAPWPLQQAEAEISVNTMAQGFGIELPAVKPILHFAKKIETVIWPLRQAKA
ncbi:YqjF family protein [Effusibacillus lacus]|nr:DUF2071 domain-containing protein [Effusibacillus lacus]